MNLRNELDISVYVTFKRKRHSSGTIRDGAIHLAISDRLPPAERERHIRLLTERLTAQFHQVRALAAQWAAEGPPDWLAPSPVTDDAALTRWAAQINAQYYRFTLGKVSFKRQEARWGSCSGRTRGIAISDRLRGGPHALLEYVLVHEIAHLGELNHSPRFWALVERALPDWRARRAMLRRYEELLRAGLLPLHRS
jgi:hypothetical protein